MEKINLQEHAIAFCLPKAKKWKPIHLHDEVFEALANRLPVGRPDGRIFPWRDHHGVYG